MSTETVVQKTQTTSKTSKLRWTPDKALWLLGFAGLLIGGVGLMQRLMDGLRPTDLSSFVPWGLWVAAYEYLVWLEVGSLFMFTLLVYIFKWNSVLPGMARTLYLTAVAILGMALILIGLDLGHPFRAWHVLVYPQWGSLMTWMIWLHVIYMVVLLTKLFLELRPTPKLKRLGTWLSYISLPLGIALVVVAGSVFGVVIGRPTWQGSALPLYFLLSALVAGTALLTFQFVVFYSGPRGEAYLTTARRLGQLFLGLLIVGLIASALGGLVILYPGVPAQATALHLTLFGPYWWVYWVFHIGLGVIVPTILLLTRTQTARRIAVAAGLFIITFIAVPLNIVIPPQLVVEVVEKGLVVAYQGPGLHASYFPTLSEWLVTLFALSFGFLVFLYGYNVLWLRPHAAEPVEEK
ncbi:MAG TPA: polysulfide reductase NrfD [Chloroflexota bacterium]|nr:polysulfide reductase NrfD [Chloroflexota bacterium]